MIRRAAHACLSQFVACVSPLPPSSSPALLRLLSPPCLLPAALQRTAWLVPSPWRRNFAAGGVQPAPPEAASKEDATNSSSSSSSSSGGSGGGSRSADSGGSGDDEPETLLAPWFPALDALRWTVSSLIGRAAISLVTRAVDPFFDEPAFLSGSCDAFTAVHEAWQTGTLGSLSALAAPPVAAAFEEAAAAYTAQGLRAVLEITQLRSATIIGATICHAESVGQPAEAPVAHTWGGRPAGSAPRPPYYLVFTVRYESTERCKLFSLADGTRVATLRNTRGHVWRFARSLPHDLPVSTPLESDWKLVDVS